QPLAATTRIAATHSNRFIASSLPVAALSTNRNPAPSLDGRAELSTTPRRTIPPTTKNNPGDWRSNRPGTLRCLCFGVPASHSPPPPDGGGGGGWGRPTTTPRRRRPA